MDNYFDVRREVERIKRDFSILDYFQSLVNAGFLKYEGPKGKDHYFGFLSQRTGSIAVDPLANVWYDHSAGRGGGIIDAVQIFENKSFIESVHRLLGSPPEGIIKPKQKHWDVPKIEVTSVGEIFHEALLAYIRSRGLEPKEIVGFASEVHWKNRGKSQFAIGFRNNSGGWVLRSSIFKGNILAGGISVLELGKPEKVKIFEGWFDFLSYLKLSDSKNFKAIILNSTANINGSLVFEILMENKTVDLYLDNDDAGDKCTSRVIKWAQLFRFLGKKGIPIDLNTLVDDREMSQNLQSILRNYRLDEGEMGKVKTNVFDNRSQYAGFKDLNAFLIGKDL